MTTAHEVAVVGGGPVGVLLAALLAAEGIDVVVLERRDTEPTLSRAIGLHPPALAVLERIGAASVILDGAVRVRRGIARSRGRTLGSISFDRVSRAHPFVATSPQHATEAVLRRRLEAIAPGSLLRGRTVRSLEQDDDGVVLTTVDPDGGEQRLSAAFVVGADGARSTVRDLLGVPTRGRTYPDHYVMGDFADPEVHAEDAAVVDVGPFGAVESFPLPDGRRRLVVLTPRRGASAAEIAGIVGARTGAAPDPDTCTMLSDFGVRRRFVDRMVHGRVVLVGDAAHEISPIGGQGMNLGWLDVGALAPILVAALRPGGGAATRPVRVPPDLAAFDRERLRSARVAARQAEWNMAAGRPASGSSLRAREALLGGVLHSPAAGLLASVYAMRFA